MYCVCLVTKVNIKSKSMTVLLHFFFAILSDSLLHVVVLIRGADDYISDRQLETSEEHGSIVAKSSNICFERNTRTLQVMDGIVVSELDLYLCISSNRSRSS